MRLNDLAAGIAVVEAGGGIDIRALSVDSRTAGPGTLFAAVPGSKADGRGFIPAAVAQGAVAVLSPPPAPAVPEGVGIAVSEDVRRALALIAARFYGRQPDVVTAVTGTNGKTSTAVFTRALWAALGHASASLGTLGASGPDWTVPGSLTTPDPITLHRLLAEAEAKGITHLCMEASSHGLDQERLAGVDIAAAAFTNLTRDHLDYHRTEAAYFAAKSRLFTEVLRTDGTAVINADSPYGAALAEATQATGRRVWTFGEAGTDIRLTARTPHGAGQTLDLSVLSHAISLELPLVGGFQAANALAALGLVLATGADIEAATAALARLPGVPGRLEYVGSRRTGGAVYVDYAHTPDALETVLTALRPHVAGKLVCVFGAGGDRDRGKRPLMAAAAARLADRVIVTDDNPRTEDAAAVRREVLAGAPDAREIGDRHEAIRAAIAEAQAGDIVLLAGKGHESGQIIGTVSHPFDDRVEARAAIAIADGETAR